MALLPPPASGETSGGAEADFIEFLQARERNPGLSLAEFSAGRPETEDELRNMLAMWRLLETGVGPMAIDALTVPDAPPPRPP
jgi:hypothetical protein